MTAAAGMGPLESEMLQVLWARRPVPGGRDVLDRRNAGRGKKLAYTTVMTILARLTEKGWPRRESAGRGFRYEPVAADPPDWL